MPSSANIADIAQIYELTDRVDTHFADELVAADPWGEQPANAGPWTTPLPDVSATGYIAMPTTEGPVQESDLEGQPQDANGIINGLLRPNQPVATSVPEVPAAATLTASELQAYVRPGLN